MTATGRTVGDERGAPPLREALFAAGTTREGGQVIKTLELVRELTEDQRQETWAMESVLAHLTVDSGFADLTRSYRDLTSSLDDLRAADRAHAALAESVNVRRRFRHWLADFRTFDDRTSAWISAAFGKDHAAYARFKDVLRAEYDNNFAYRLCCTLRNASTHAANVINHMWWHVTTDEDDRPVHIPVMQFDGPGLAGQFDLKASVARELAALAGRLDVELVAQTVMLSCKHAHFALVAALWEEIEPERTLCADLHGEAVEKGGESALFVNLDTLDADLGRIDHRYNPLHLLRLAEQHHSLAQAECETWSVEATADELAALTQERYSNLLD